MISEELQAEMYALLKEYETGACRDCPDRKKAVRELLARIDEAD